MTINETNFTLFAEAYKRNLIEQVRKTPEEYMPGTDAVKLADKMMASLRRDTRGVNIQSATFRKTCKDVGIAFSYTAIEKFITAA